MGQADSRIIRCDESPGISSPLHDFGQEEKGGIHGCLCLCMDLNVTMLLAVRDILVPFSCSKEVM